MKTYHITTVCWPFDRLFPGNQFVFGDFRYSGDVAKVCIGEVRLSKLIRNAGDPRTLTMSVKESQFGPSVMHDGHLSATLMPHAEKLGIHYYGSASQSEWLLKPGEQALDGAIRIARTFFELINLRTESPVHGVEDLLPHFVTHEQTRVYDKGLEKNSLEEWLRRRHRLKTSPLDTWALDWLYSGWHESYAPPHDGCCHVEDRSLKFNFPETTARLVYCWGCRRHWFRPSTASDEWVTVDSNTAEILKLRFGLSTIAEVKAPKKTEADYNVLSGNFGP